MERADRRRREATPSRVNTCAWCFTPLEPLALSGTDLDAVLQLGRLCTTCWEWQEAAR